MPAGLGSRKDKGGRADLERGDLFRERLRVVNDVMRAERLDPFLRLGPRGGGDHGQVSQGAHELNRDRADAARAADDEDGVGSACRGSRLSGGITRCWTKFTPSASRASKNGSEGEDQLGRELGKGSLWERVQPENQFKQPPLLKLTGG